MMFFDCRRFWGTLSRVQEALCAVEKISKLHDCDVTGGLKLSSLRQEIRCDNFRQEIRCANSRSLAYDEYDRFKSLNLVNKNEQVIISTFHNMFNL